MYVNTIIELLAILGFSVGVYILTMRDFQRFIRLPNRKRLGFKDVKSKFFDLKIIKNLRSEQKDKEIYEAISFLRNLTTVGLSKVMSTDRVLEELVELQSSLKFTYGKMLGLLRINRPEEAAGLLHNHVGTPISRDFGRLLMRWDEINPEELTETLISHQKSIKEIRRTQQKKRDEVLSDLIYLPVVINVIILLINFIYVGYFMEQQALFQTYF